MKMLTISNIDVVSPCQSYVGFNLPGGL